MEDLEVVTCYMPTNQPAKQCNQIGPMSRCIDQHFATFNNETEPKSTINGQSRLKFCAMQNKNLAKNYNFATHEIKNLGKIYYV